MVMEDKRELEEERYSQGSSRKDVPLPPSVLQTEPMSIFSLVCGIISMPLSLCCGIFGLPLPIAAIVLGFISRSKINSEPMRYGGGGMAMAGIIMGGLSIALTLLMLIINLLFIANNPEFQNVIEEMKREFTQKMQ